jgi:hypothetical protein
VVLAVRHNSTEAHIRDYFWSLVDKNGPLPDPATGVKSKCWLRLGSVTDQGYGRFKAGGKTYMGTRFAWRETGKPDPGAQTVYRSNHATMAPGQGDPTESCMVNVNIRYAKHDHSNERD